MWIAHGSHPPETWYSTTIRSDVCRASIVGAAGVQLPLPKVVPLPQPVRTATAHAAAMTRRPNWHLRIPLPVDAGVVAAQPLLRDPAARPLPVSGHDEDRAHQTVIAPPHDALAR